MSLAPSFPVLVDQLLRSNHEGAESRMSQASRGDLPQSTIWRWRRGLPKTYDPRLIRRLCEIHDLDFGEVMDLVDRDRRAWLNGKRVTLPDLSDIRRGPVPAQDRLPRRSRAVLPLLAGALLAATATQAIASQPRSAPTRNATHSDYVKRPGRRAVSGNTRSSRRGFPHKHAA